VATGAVARPGPWPRVAPRQELSRHAAGHLQPDEKAQRWLLSVSASDRTGLLYAHRRVLARHHINLQLAKITTWANGWKTPSSSTAPSCSRTARQIAIESELLDTLAAPA
jgi:[protein-PII] uridylyltransferase